MQSSSIKSKVIILCGGRGKGLGKITNEIPKPLIKIGKLSIIEHINIRFRSIFLVIIIFKYICINISISNNYRKNFY